MENRLSSPGLSNGILNEIKVYKSSESEGEVEQPEHQETRKRKSQKNWIFLKEFTSAALAEDFVKSENTWSRNYTRNTEDGMKKYFRCNKVKKRGPQCDAELCLLYVNDGENVIAYLTDSEHTHDIIGTQDYGIQAKTKTEINKLLDLRLKPRAILAALADMEGVKLPNKRQLNNYLRNYRIANSGNSAISLAQLEQWFLDHENIPEDGNEVFVIRYHVTKGVQPNFRFALSTKRLLEIIYFTDNIHADTRYKIKWQGFPVLIVGTTDKNCKFHPVCLGVATDEHQEDFEVIFQGLKEKALLIYDHVMKPRVLVCDAAQSIQNAFLEVFGAETTIRVCWSHVKKTIQKELLETVTEHNQKDVIRDLDVLKNASSLEIFEAASQAFLEKWQNEARFVEYIKKEWLEKNSNWYLGADSLSPSTNNSLESFVRSVKDQNTLRERLSLSNFLMAATDMLAQWSLQVSLPEATAIDLEDWTEAYVWANKDIKLDAISSDTTNDVYLICDQGNVSYSQWKTFDEYTVQTSCFHKTVLPNTDWRTGSCDCPQFFLKYMCRHILGLAIRLNLTEAPLEARMKAVDRKRKRGRPARSKAVIILQ